MGRISTWALIGIFTVTTGCGSGLIMTDVHTPSDEALAAATDWAELNRLSPGTTVLVDVDESGAVRGKIAAVSAAALTVTGHAPIPRASIQRVSRLQSLSRQRARRGAAIGFGIGVFVLAATGGLFWQPVVGYPLLGAGIGSGSAIGVTRQTVVYQRR
jgi:hypothetical protein